MDGGSSINILYYDTFQRLGLKDSSLQPTSTVFHGIVPGRSAQPVGKITLGVTFGTEENFRSEFLCFEVLKFQSPYHALFGIAIADDDGTHGGARLILLFCPF